MSSRTNTEAPTFPQELIDHLQRLAAGGFYGKVEISFQAGKALQIREERVVKVADLQKEGA